MNRRNLLLGIVLFGLGWGFGRWAVAPSPQAPAPFLHLKALFGGSNEFSVSLNLPETKPAATLPKWNVSSAGPRANCQANWEKAIRYNFDRIGKSTGYLQITAGALEGVLGTLKSFADGEVCPGVTSSNYAQVMRTNCEAAMTVGPVTARNGFAHKVAIESCLSGFARYRAAAMREAYRGRDINTIKDVETLLQLYLAERERARLGPAEGETANSDSLLALGNSDRILDRIFAIDPENVVALRYRVEADVMMEFLDCSPTRPRPTCPETRRMVDEDLERLVHAVGSKPEPLGLAFSIQKDIYRDRLGRALRAANLLEAFGEKSAAYYYRAWIENKQGNTAKAIALLNKAITYQVPATNFWSLPIPLVMDELEHGRPVASFPPFSLPVSYTFEVTPGPLPVVANVQPR